MAKDWKAEATDLRKLVKNLEKETIEFDDETNSVSIRQRFTLHPNTYEYLKANKSQGTDVVRQALDIGLLAAQQGRIYNALTSFNTSISGEYALLQQHMSTLDEKFKRDNKAKTDVEFVLRDQLQQYSDTNNINDIFALTGSSAENDDGNKTGDVEARIQLSSGESVKIAIESKMAQTYTKGDKRSTTAKKLRADQDTAISQMIESRSNRDAAVCLFVIDETLNPFPGPGIEFFPEPIRSFIVRVNVQEDDYTNLHHAYMIARSMALAPRQVTDPEGSTLNFFIENILQSLNRQKFIKEIGKRTLEKINTSHENLVSSVESELMYFDAELDGLTNSLEFMHSKLNAFLEKGTISASDALEIYQQKDAKKLYEAKLVEWKKDEETDSDDDVVESTPSGAYEQTSLDSMSVADLKEKCKELGLPVGGKKADLIERITNSKA